jgi:hypothetical protein
MVTSPPMPGREWAAALSSGELLGRALVDVGDHRVVVETHRR